MEALKISVARTMTPRPLWQRRFYGVNVFTNEKRFRNAAFRLKAAVHHPETLSASGS
jgi:hypothetical protein